MKTMKKVTALLLALMMVLSLAACGNSGKDDNGGNGGKDQPAAVDMTAQEVLDTLKEKLGDSYGCDLAEDESRMTGYYELDMSKIDSWAAESSENSALDPQHRRCAEGEGRLRPGRLRAAANRLSAGAGLLPHVQHERGAGGAGPSVRQRRLCGAADPGAGA